MKRIEDTIENKENIYGNYVDQSIAIATILEALDGLHIAKFGKPMPADEKVDYTFMALKMTRSVTAKEHVDSYLDLANYARLACIKRTGHDILDELCKIKKQGGENVHSD